MRPVKHMCVQNVIQYSGSKEERELIVRHEFLYAEGSGRARQMKFDVLLTSYEYVQKDPKTFRSALLRTHLS